ncbi:MAG TPA: TlpA disulfide reductase family protein [Candidatus Margulisiibacteriota bacterium]|nr:TlpA disulfide reductase family protein [Candidatus Margulisiibacteriota bacterium]
MPSKSRSEVPQPTRRTLLRGTAALALFGWGAIRGSVAYAASLRVGAPAPPATLVTLDGQRISTSDLRGQVVILTFWATWCVPCRKELPVLSTYAREHAAQGLVVLGFSLDEPDGLREVRELAKSYAFPVGLLVNSSAEGYGRIWRMPANFTIDREGRLADNAWKDKQSSWNRERLERVVAPLLATPR